MHAQAIASRLILTMASCRIPNFVGCRVCVCVAYLHLGQRTNEKLFPPMPTKTSQWWGWFDCKFPVAAAGLAFAAGFESFVAWVCRFCCPAAATAWGRGLARGWLVGCEARGRFTG